LTARTFTRSSSLAKDRNSAKNARFNLSLLLTRGRGKENRRQQNNLSAGGKVMHGEKLASIRRLQESARPRPPLRSALCAALLLGIAAAWGAPALAASTLVTAPDGKFQGKLDTTGTMREFLGMRYAQPAAGNLRWKAPQPVTPSVITQDATQFGNHCPQTFSPFGNATLTEDCLFLNVFTPNMAITFLPATTRAR
jgi:hypothetical protein